MDAAAAPHWLTAPPPSSLPMSAERLRWCLNVLGWPTRELAIRLSVRDETAYHWARGTKNIPNTVAAWLEVLVAHALLAPPLPDGWELPD